MKLHFVQRSMESHHFESLSAPLLTPEPPLPPPHFEKSGYAPVTHPILRIFIVENMSLVLAEGSNNCESKKVMYYWKEECVSFIQKQTYANRMYIMHIIINEGDVKVWVSHRSKRNFWKLVIIEYRSDDVTKNFFCISAFWIPCIGGAW